MNFLTYWQLQEDYNIELPIIQRDYAQGRETGRDAEDIKHIREQLVNNLVSALKENGKLTVNFVYGKEKSDSSVFIPIDGQQRLTMLFLLHWYVLTKAKTNKNIKPLLYKTRTTTENFCENLCKDIENLPDDTPIGAYIENQLWFNKSFLRDPSVKSMLVVLNTIEQTVKDAKLDIKKAAEYLTDDNCKIGFVFLSLDDFDDEDLYIKMNSRGKKLTNFEIFKAKVQDSEALKEIYADELKRVEYIGRFNNEYCNLFYKFAHKSGNGNFDAYMMRFVQDLIKCDHYAEAINQSVNRNAYREDYNTKDIRKMSGSVFYENYIKDPLTHGSAPKSPDPFKIAAKESLSKLDSVLNFMSTDKFDKLVSFNVENAIEKHKFENDGLNLILIDEKNELHQDAYRYAVYEFVYQMNPDSDEKLKAFYHWLRFANNSIKNTNFNGSDISANMMFLFKKILANISNSENYDYKTVLKSIKDATFEKVSDQIRQKTEEQIKAQLMLETDEWEKLILEAEGYYTDGQINFLLEFAKDDADDYDVGLFKDYFERSKLLLDGDKNPKAPEFLFERALLSLKDSNTEKTGYLVKDTSAQYTMRCKESFKIELLESTSRNFIKTLLDKMGSRTDAEAFLRETVDAAAFTDSKEKWKNIFIEENVPDLIAKYNKEKGEENSGIGRYIAFEQNNDIVLLLRLKQTGSFNIDLATFMLYAKVNDAVRKELRLNFATTTAMKDDNNLPCRFVEKNGLRIGYDYNSKEYINLDIASDRYELSEAVRLLET